MDNEYFLGDPEDESDDHDSWHAIHTENYIDLLDRSRAFEEIMHLYERYQNYHEENEGNLYQVHFSEFPDQDSPLVSSDLEQQGSIDPEFNPATPNAWFDDSGSDEDKSDERMQRIESELNSLRTEFEEVKRRRWIRSASISLSLTMVGLVGSVASLGIWLFSLGSISGTFQVFSSVVIGLVSVCLLVLGATGFYRSIHE